MSAALIATSVPEPRARPRLAAASAGPSLTPSPTIATECPAARRRAMTAALSAGRAPAMTSSTPAVAPTAFAVASLSPVSRTDRRPSRRSSASARAAEGLIVSLTARRPRIWLSHSASTVVQPPCSHRAACSDSAAGMAMPRSRKSLARPTVTSWPATTPRAPRPGRAVNPLGCGRSPASARAAELIAAATACSDACSTDPA